MTSKTSKDQLTLRIPKELNDLLQKQAEKTGIVKNALITTALWQFVKKTSNRGNYNDLH